MSDCEAIWFSDHCDGRITADRFPKRILIAPELLREGDACYLTREGRTVRIRVSNGEAAYRLTGRNRARTLWGYTVFAAERQWVTATAEGPQLPIRR